MPTRMERFDEFKLLAENNIARREDAARVYATLALATAVVRIGDLLAELVVLAKEREERERNGTTR